MKSSSSERVTSIDWNQSSTWPMTCHARQSPHTLHHTTSPALTCTTNAGWVGAGCAGNRNYKTSSFVRSVLGSGTAVFVKNDSAGCGAPSKRCFTPDRMSPTRKHTIQWRACLCSGLHSTLVSAHVVASIVNDGQGLPAHWRRRNIS